MAERLEHKIFRGAHYTSGIIGSRLLIVGFSHWDKADNENKTIETVELLFGDRRDERSLIFFWNIQSYFVDFGNSYHQDPEVFWHSVAFMNFIGNSVGPAEDRYRDASQEEASAGAERLLSEMKRIEPDKVFVFSAKASRLMPDEARVATSDGSTEPVHKGDYDVLTYAINGRAIPAYLFRHPQGAPYESMRRGVNEAMHDGRS